VRHHHPDGLRIVNNGDFYARDIQFFMLIVHFRPQLSVRFRDALHNGGCRHSICGRGSTHKEKLDICRETGVFAAPLALWCGELPIAAGSADANFWGIAGSGRGYSAGNM
jgi:hypothetical protein